MYYIAGDRVIMDPVAKPFSMGRNLICVHSKRHMDDDPKTKAAKMATNQRSVREMGKLFKQGGIPLWVAPSGGRDRKDESGEYAVSGFDPSAVMLLYRLMASAKIPAHIYPMAMASAEILPPPETVQKDLGEERKMDFRGVGISIGEELDTKAILAGIEDKNEQAEKLSSVAYEKVKELYKPLADKVYREVEGGKEFSQPWDGKDSRSDDQDELRPWLDQAGPGLWMEQDKNVEKPPAITENPYTGSREYDWQSAEKDDIQWR